MRSEVLIALNIKIMIFWDVTLKYLTLQRNLLPPSSGGRWKMETADYSKMLVPIY
jgi:hypothetical protein